jgi:hypothetical protein
VECALLPAKVVVVCHSGLRFSWPTKWVTVTQVNGTIFHRAEAALEALVVAAAVVLEVSAVAALAAAALAEAGKNILNRKGIVF